MTKTDNSECRCGEKLQHAQQALTEPDNNGCLDANFDVEMSNCITQILLDETRKPDHIDCLHNTLDVGTRQWVKFNEKHYHNLP